MLREFYGLYPPLRELSEQYEFFNPTLEVIVQGIKNEFYSRVVWVMIIGVMSLMFATLIRAGHGEAPEEGSIDDDDGGTRI